MDKHGVTAISARAEGVIFEELQQVCCSPGYIHAVAYLCWRDNVIRYSGDQVTHEDIQRQYSHEKLLRTEISTLIGLMVKGEIGLGVPTPSIMQNYVDKSDGLMHEMHMSLQKPWMAALHSLATNPEAMDVDPFDTAEGLREPIFYGGESAYNFQYMEFARLRYSADDRWLKSNVGFTIEEACSVIQALCGLQLQKLRDIRKAMRAIPPDKWTLLPAFVFGTEELAKKSAMDCELIAKVIRKFCFDSARRNRTFSSLSDFNEINAAPIIEIGEDSFVLLQNYSLIEAIYEAPFFWFMEDKSYRSVASANRGAFAEGFLADRLSRIFGGKHVFQNVDIYRGKDRVGEADVLVLYGDRAIVAQVKSKRLTIEARKGNDLQLKDDFKKAIGEAYDQAMICSHALLSGECRFALPLGGEVKIPDKLRYIFPLCVVSDHYPALAAQVRQFLDVSTSKIIRSPIITDVFFVDVLSEILESPLHFLNYFDLRARFDKQLAVSQELATLGYHLKHNLWLEEQYNMVNLGDDFSIAIDLAMLARRTGIPGERVPKGILTRFRGTPIGTILSDVEAAGTPELVGLGLLLLQLGSESAKYINDGIRTFRKSSVKDGRQHDLSIPIEKRKSGLTIHVSPFPEDVATDRLVAHCKLRKYDSKSDVWYGILLSPTTGRVREAVVLEFEWMADPAMESALELWPRKPMMPLASLSSNGRKPKVGRNDPCPCGSGIKYKKCCLGKDRH